MSTKPNRFVLKEKSKNDSKIIDFLTIFRERYGKNPVFASRTNYLANEVAKEELAVIHPDSSVAKLFEGRIPCIDDLLENEIKVCDSEITYSLNDKESILDSDTNSSDLSYNKTNSQENTTNQYDNLLPISYFHQRNYVPRQEIARSYQNMPRLESRLGGETYYAKGSGISYRRAS